MASYVNNSLLRCKLCRHVSTGPASKVKQFFFPGTLLRLSQQKRLISLSLSLSLSLYVLIVYMRALVHAIP